MFDTEDDSDRISPVLPVFFILIGRQQRSYIQLFLTPTTLTVTRAHFQLLLKRDSSA